VIWDFYGLPLFLWTLPLPLRNILLILNSLIPKKLSIFPYTASSIIILGKFLLSFLSREQIGTCNAISRSVFLNFHTKLLLDVGVAWLLRQTHMYFYPSKLIVEQDFRLFDRCLDLLNGLDLLSQISNFGHGFCERILLTEKFIKEFDILSWLCFTFPDAAVSMTSYMYISARIESQLFNSVHTNDGKILVTISHFFQCFCSFKALYS
jgi:hypothetical protein